ncbi:GAF domain-containing protein [Paenisporosarcina antarctica]|uniref:GAF domain-containing protein n=1 Tax=Paenisporosarcina antarctica TaxID=417367 RepID=A0A4P6ZXF5_9BACL|nr:GAF domain-containing protein [Paenisporosarcina antarctica]QBP41082.1 GAF domain-containing protein [Paenisporosarcina antarctica]
MTNKADYQTEIERIRLATGCDIIALALVETAENQYELKWKYASGNLNNRFKQIVLQSGRGVAGLVFKTGKPLLMSSISDFLEKDNLFNYPILTLEKLKSIGALPLWHDGRVAGVLLGGFREDLRMTEDLLQCMLEMSVKGIGKLDGRKELMLN